ncbi:MAG: endonuclease/exonuclease/phosphatase family protein [Phycisphaerae bacterium]|jgi:endonuclease/exonuclease/phosphatase family metal-dependent hydrolase|nr:endonuclease/exonuclease/phosphatase family protein [Phycisphaerae bacterium]
MKWLAFNRWPLVGRFRNRYVRRVLGLLVLTVMVCLVWFFTNRALSPLNAVRIETVRVDGAEAGSFDGTLRVVTFNIAHGRGLTGSNWQLGRKEAQLSRLDQIAALLRDANADIVVLNEVDFDAVWTSGVNQARYIARKAGFPFLAEQRNFDMAIPFFSLRWGNAILSKRPIANAQCVNFAAHATWERIVAGHKKGLLCEIELGDGSVTRVLGVHLDTRSESTRLPAAKQIENIRAESKTPLILAGDMNSGPLGFPDVRPTSDGRTCMSYLLATGAYRTDPLSEPGPDDYTFPSSNPTRTIDWILVTREWKITSRTVLNRQLSDHNAVLMEIQFESAEQR